MSSNVLLHIFQRAEDIIFFILLINLTGQILFDFLLFLNSLQDILQLTEKYKQYLSLHKDKTNKMTCAPSEDSDQPGHLPSLISLHCPYEEAWSPCLSLERTAKALIRLGRCPGYIRVFEVVTDIMHLIRYKNYNQLKFNPLWMLIDKHLKKTTHIP